MKRKWIIVFLALAVVGLVICLPRSNRKGSVTVRFVTVTNDITGARIAFFSALNSTDRLFVRGRSEIEVQGNVSNQVTVTQITNVNYLQAGQSLSFSVPCPVDGSPWRLKFYYIGQFRRLESMRYEFGWALKRRGIPIPAHRLPEHDIREIATEWISK